MFHREKKVSLKLLVTLALFGTSLTVDAQGPGSCGIHLDILGNLTSTHAAVADVPGYPGAFGGYPAGAPGNPFNAYCAPGSVAKLRLTVAPSALGPAPFGPGATVSILYAFGAVPTPFFPPPGFLPACAPGAPWILSVLPPAGAVVDGVGLFGPPSVPPAGDPGHPLKLEVPLAVPFGFPVGIPVFFQAVIIDPVFGMLGVSNGVALIGGPNPAEVSLVPGLIPLGGFPATDEGYAPIPTPPGFTFYGFPVPACNVNTNGFIDFVPGIPPGADFAGTPGDLGCPPATATASPRLAVNHFDIDLAIPVTALRVTDLTVEVDPGIFGIPRTIVRWKNVANFGSPASPPAIDTNYASMVAELWGPIPAPPVASIPGRMIVVRQEQHSVTTLANHDMVGIGPGPLLPFGPPAGCAAAAYWGLWGFPPIITVAGAGSYQDTVFDSMILSNLAVVFDPFVAGIVPIPLPYAIGVY